MNRPVLIPVNDLARAKGRLAGLLSPEEREQLALITLQTVLHAAGPDAIVLTPDERIAGLVAGRARVLMESPKARGLNGQLEFALRELGALADVLILHADLPLATQGAVETLWELVTDNSVTLVESGDGGTNAMLLCPPGQFQLAYGQGSFAKHVQAAQAAGMALHLNQNRELRLDLDNPSDITELLRAPRGRQGAAGRYLLSIGIEERLGAATA